MVEHWNMNRTTEDQVATESKPDRIQIGPMLYTISEVENLTGTDEQNRVVNLFGDVDYGQQLIRIEANMSPERKHATVWHEALHVALEQAGIDDHDEQVITIIGYVVHGILKENPWMATP